MTFQEAIAAMRDGAKVALPHWAIGIAIHLPHGNLVKWTTRQGYPYILNMEEAMSEEWFVAPKDAKENPYKPKV
jgi:hypothetical protein